MSGSARHSRFHLSTTAALTGGAVFLIAGGLLLVPDRTTGVLAFVAESLVSVAPIVIPGILLAAWIMASGAGEGIARMFAGHMLKVILIASAIGAITPVCGVTVLPLMAGLLAAGVPLAPVMAFWLSSPITDPAMLAVTAATLGPEFAIGKTLAAFALGIWGGVVSAALARRDWAISPLRSNGIVGSLSQAGCSTQTSFDMQVWKTPERRRIFTQTMIATTRLILICLIPAFAAEHLLGLILQPQALSAYVGEESRWAIPLAVLVGAPAYVDGYAALPLTRALLDHGMSAGAAMAFLISGGVVSIWGAIAIFPVLKPRPFLLYLVLAISGSMAAGHVFGWLA